jgi:hypothetical protein
MSDARERQRPAVIPDRPLAWWAWLLVLVPAVLSTAWLVWTVPRYAGVYGQPGGNPPLLTRWLGAAPWMLFAWPAAVTVLAHAHRRRHSRWLALLVASVAGSLLVFALALLVLTLPLFLAAPA